MDNVRWKLITIRRLLQGLFPYKKGKTAYSMKGRRFDLRETANDKRILGY